MRTAGHHAVSTIASLDGLRALAVLIVVVAHAGFGNVIPGGLGVTIFFFLSGFLITTLMVREHAATGKINVPGFYCRRFLRLFPPLFITLVLAYGLVLAGVLGGGATVQGFVAQMLYFANYYVLFFDGTANVPSGTGVLWSLAVEEHYYIFFPLLIVPCLRHWQPRRIGQLLIVLCAICLLWRVHLASQTGFQAERTYYATDTRFDSILFGAVLAMMKNPLIDSKAGQPMRAGNWWLFALGLFGLAFSVVFRDTFFRETLRYTVQGISLMPIFYFVISRSATPAFRPLNWPLVKRMGVHSYAIYLLHFVVIQILQDRLHLAAHPVICLVATLGLATAYAMLIERFIDVPLQAVRARYR